MGAQVNHRADFEHRMMETGGNPEAALMNAVREIARLKAGDFTPDEIHNICHNLHRTVGPREFADACAAEQRKLYGYAPDREPSPFPLLVYMEAQTRAERSAAFLRTYARRLLDKTAASWEIPNTVAQTLTDIADFIIHQQQLRATTDDSTIELLQKLQAGEFNRTQEKDLIDAVINEMRDWDRSFALYHTALRQLDAAYKLANGTPENVMPDTTKVAIWAATELESLRARKDAAYEERNRVVAALSKVFPAHRARHPEEDASWERDWMTIVCIHSPAGQLTWHVHDTQVGLFAHLPDGPNHWDGHDTPEKYRRLDAVPVQAWTPTADDLVTLRRALLDFTNNNPDGGTWARRNEHIADARALLKEMPWVAVTYPPLENPR